MREHRGRSADMRNVPHTPAPPSMRSVCTYRRHSNDAAAGAVCGPCYRRLRRNPAACASCREVRPLVGVRDGGGSVCGPCSGDARNWVCDGCGQVDLLIGGTRCLACTTTARVHSLLTGPDGQITTQLQGVATFLLNDNTAEQAQHVINGAGWMQLLVFAGTGNPITHELLDVLPPG